MTTRKYQSRAQKTSLASALAAGATSMTVNSGSILAVSAIPAGQTYTVVIDPDTSLEEIVDITNWSSGNTFTIARGIDGSQDVAHSAGAVVRHMSIGRDFREANTHVENTTTAHGLTIGNLTLSTGTGNVSNTMLASNAVTTAKITDLNVTTAKIADSAITSAKIADLTIATGDIADSAITSDKIAALTITTGDIADSAITTAKIAANAVTTVDIADLNVTTAKIADSAITSGKIADGTIVNADVNSSAQIAYGKLTLTNSVVNADINASAAIALSKLATDPLARANHTGTQAASTISDFDTQVRTSKVTDLAAPTASFSMNSQKITSVLDPTSAQDAATKAYADTKIASTEKGAVNGVATLGSDGKLTTAQIPDVTITDTSVVSSQAAMLALTAQVGDVAVRTDLNKSFILKTAGASTLANWQELLTPTDSVQSVDGQTGTVNLSSTYATVANAANKLPLAGGTMSGAIAMGANKITGLGDPTLAQDAATKNYIDTVVLAPSNLTGPITSVGNVTSVAAQTGTGSTFVMNTSPTITTPNINSINTTAPNSSPSLWNNVTNGNVVISGSQTTGATAISNNTAFNGTVNIASGAGTVNKTVNIATASTGGTTTVNIGSTAGATSTVTISGTPIPASKTLVATDSTTYVVPSQTGNTGKYLTTDGSVSSWDTVPTASAATPTVAGTVFGETDSLTPFATALGYEAALNTTGTSNTAVGYQALKANTTGFQNTAVGKDAVRANTTSSNITGIGSGALRDNTGQNNTAVGASAMIVSTTGTNNTAVGASALAANLTHSSNTAVGFNALALSTATGATAVGANALDANTTGSANTALGFGALGANTTGSYSTAIGYNALQIAVNSSNTALGHNAGNATTGGGNIIIGANAQSSVANALYEITLGDSNITRFRIPGIGFDINRDIELMNIMGAY